MKGLLTLSNQRAILKEYDLEFLNELKLTIENYVKDPECLTDVRRAISKVEHIAAPLASDHDTTACFDVEAIVEDTIVLSFVDLVK